MTASATLKTIREALGLPVGWLAAQTGVQERTVRYWEAGRNQVPDDVAELIGKAEGVAARLVAEACRVIDGQIAKRGLPSEPILLVRYRTDEELWRFRPDMEGLPVTYHAAILARVRWAVLERHPTASCLLEWLDVDAYESWLKATNQRDSEAMRAQFVTLQS